MPRWLTTMLTLVPLGLAVSMCTAELPGPTSCTSGSECSGKDSCVLGRCQPPGRPPVSLDAERLLFGPIDWVKLSAKQEPQAPTDGEVITLGDPAAGSELLLLRFATKLPPGARVQRAFVVLAPMPQCASRPAAIRLELSHVLSSWRSESLSWSRQPKLGLPMRVATVRTLPARPLRLDVTDLLRQWQSHPNRHHGLGLSAAGTGPGKACYTAGLTGGHGPRLEVYLAPAKLLQRAGDAGDAGDSSETEARDAAPDAEHETDAD
jgi:hypothetical protein